MILLKTHLLFRQWKIIGKQAVYKATVNIWHRVGEHLVQKITHKLQQHDKYIHGTPQLVFEVLAKNSFYVVIFFLACHLCPCT